MNLKLFIENIKNDLQVSLKRFWLSLIFLWSFTISTTLAIVLENDDKWLLGLIVSFGSCFIYSVLVRLYVENKEEKKIVLGSYLSVLAYGLVIFLLTYYYIENQYGVLLIVGCNLAWLFIIMAVLWSYEGKDSLLAYLLKELVYCYFVASVLFGGILICLLAFNYLIISISDIFKWILVLALICELAIPVTIFLSKIPLKDGEIAVDKATRVIINRVGLGVYLLLILILIIYLVKVAITLNLPSGKINWFASFALLFYCFFLLTNKDEENKVSQLFVKFGGFVLIPIFLMQQYAIIVRVLAYGLTTVRYISILLNIMALLFIISSIYHKMTIKQVFLGCAIITMIACVGPLNVISVPARNQVRLIKQVLLENDMLDGQGRVWHTTNISLEDKNKIRESVYYLKYSDFHNYPSFLHEALRNEYDFKKVFGFTYRKETVVSDEVHCYYGKNLYDIKVDVEGYKVVKMVYISQTIDEELQDYIYSLYKQYGSSYDGQLEFDHSNGDHYVFVRINATFKNDYLINYNIEAYVLSK